VVLGDFETLPVKLRKEIEVRLKEKPFNSIPGLEAQTIPGPVMPITRVIDRERDIHEVLDIVWIPGFGP
jgi:hypothetical protein